MTKRQKRLAKLLRAAKRLHYDSKVIPISYNKYSCNAVERAFGAYIDPSAERVAYDESVGASMSAYDLYWTYTEQSQLARQLAVLMYREGIKRGKYD